jgi:hypothetical protein
MMNNAPSLTADFKIKDIELEPSMSEEEYLRYEPMIDQVAAQEWKNSCVFEMDDLAQALWVWVLENRSHLLDRDRDLQFFMIRRYARGWAAGQRVDYMYSTGAFLYTPKLVREYLGNSVYTEPEEAVDVDARVDILRAIKEKVPRAPSAAIYKKFALKEELSNTERAAYYRGVDVITHFLNGEAELTVIPYDEAYEL